MEKDVKLIETKLQELFKLLEIDADIEVETTDEAYIVSVDAADNNALLIGKHGNTLSSLEYITYILVGKELSEEKRIIIEIGGYREEREIYLADLAKRLKEEVMETGIEKSIRGLKPWERRHIHMTLSEDADVTTESTGEERDRVLIIKKK